MRYSGFTFLVPPPSMFSVILQVCEETFVFLNRSFFCSQAAEWCFSEITRTRQNVSAASITAAERRNTPRIYGLITASLDPLPAWSFSTVICSCPAAGVRDEAVRCQHGRKHLRGVNRRNFSAVTMQLD